MSRSSHLSCCTQLRGRSEPISNNVFSLINNPASLLANKTKVHCGLLNWMWMCGLKLANAVGDWLRQGVLRDWVCLLQPASFIYISLLSLSVMSSYNPLLARNSFYLFTGSSEFPANLQNCVFFMWSSIHCLTWETLANTELSPHVAPTPSPQLITPTSVCWPPCLYVNGPPLSPWQH